MNTQVRVFRLRFADVASTTRKFNGRSVTVPGVLDTLQAMLGLSSGVPSDAGRAGVPANFRPASPLSPASGGSPLRQALTGLAGALPPGGIPSTEAEGMMPGMAAIGRPAISVDQRTNSVVVRGSPAAIAAVEEVIRHIDQPVKMVQIEVVIATAELGVSEEIGVAFRGAARRGGAFDTGTTGGRADPTTGFNPISLLPAALSPQATVASFVVQGGQAFLQTQLRALAQRNRARILSSPHLVTLDNVTARITRSEDLYVPVDTGGLNGQGLSQIQTGLTLEITPSIVPAAAGGREQLVRLSLNAVNSAPTQGTGSRVSVRAQEVQTDVLVPDGGTFVVGGLFDDTRLQGRSGIPGLGDIPLLGALFRESTQQATLGETIFFITPRVIDQRETFARDIAAGSEAVAQVRDQRRALSGVAREMDGRPAGRGSARFLEEDQ
jgi:type II secretory pathway component GspD/PulD (secretin)